ncbi:MAG: hypothetical protein ACI4VT_02285 [Bacilli bacterium]
MGWTGSNGKTPSKNISITKGDFGDKNYQSNWKVNPYAITYELTSGIKYDYSYDR